MTLKTYDRNNMRKKKNKVKKQKTVETVFDPRVKSLCVSHYSTELQVCDQHKTLNRSHIHRKDGEINTSYTSNSYIHKIFTNLNLFCVGHEFNSDAITKLKLYHKS